VTVITCFFCATLTSTFSTTCRPNEHTFVEHWIVKFSVLSYLKADNYKLLLAGITKYIYICFICIKSNKLIMVVNEAF